MTGSTMARRHVFMTALTVVLVLSLALRLWWTAAAMLLLMLAQGLELRALRPHAPQNNRCHDS